MSKSEVVRARIEPEVKHNAEEILKELGLSSSQAIGMFYKQIIFSHGLPFDVKIPNEETQEAMLDLMLRRNVKEYTLEEFNKKYF
ncbi:MAG: type II toxin-antitoxin system RelB/DinJ family antitoxin [Candidatus Paracaedibacter sp.]